MRNHVLIVLLLACGVLLSLGASSARFAAPAENATVRIRDMQFQPGTVRIKVGGTVTWNNADDRDHTVTAVDNSFKSGNLKSGASFTFRFTKAGNFDYSCTYHPRMRGSVQVEN